MTADTLISILAGLIVALQSIMIGLVLKIGGRVTRIETQLSMTEGAKAERKRVYDRDAQDQARHVCAGLHECYFREMTPAPRTMPVDRG